jgi:hypothetical protein
VSSTTARPRGTLNQRSPLKPTFWGGSSGREGISIGKSPASNERSAARAARLAERTEEKVANASTRVVPAVASDDTVTQSTATISARP